MSEFARTFPNLSSEDFRKLEGTMGMALPEDLRRHYESFNGGTPKKNTFIADDEYRIKEFLPILYGAKGACLEDAYVDLVLNNKSFPKDVIPFASDGGGDYFCYCLSAERRGEVFFYQSDYYDDPARAVVWLAPTFNAFMKALVLPT